MSQTTTSLAVHSPSTADLITNARHALAEAKTLPDIRRVIEAASVAADAGRRAAKLAEAQGLAADVVRDAEAAANDAAAVRIEAQAKAGELLRAMAKRGERSSGRTYLESQRATPAQKLEDLGVSKSESSRWQQVAAVPADTREAYVEDTKEAGGEVTTSGLLRHAEQSQMDKDVAAAITRYPFLDGVPGLSSERLLDLAGTLDAASDAERPGMEDQARRWCSAQRELVPRWQAEDEVNKPADVIITHLLQVNAILSRRRPADVADVLLHRIAPENDIEIVRSASAHVGELAQALTSRERIRRVK
jgi:hypothetical protein